MFPFFVLPVPLRLPFESFSLPTHRQYEAKFPTFGNLLMSPVSSMIVSARIFSIPLTVSKHRYAGFSPIRSFTARSKPAISVSSASMIVRFAFTAKARSELAN